MYEEILNLAAIVIGVIGAGVIIWGVLLTVIRFLWLEITGIKKEDLGESRESLRQQFGSYILLGLEFLVAADIIKTILEPELQELLILGAIVAIRTVLSYFLNLEVSK